MPFSVIVSLTASICETGTIKALRSTTGLNTSDSTDENARKNLKKKN